MFWYIKTTGGEERIQTPGHYKINRNQNNTSPGNVDPHTIPACEEKNSGVSTRFQAFFFLPHNGFAQITPTDFVCQYQTNVTSWAGKISISKDKWKNDGFLQMVSIMLVSQAWSLARVWYFLLQNTSKSHLSFKISD